MNEEALDFMEEVFEFIIANEGSTEEDMHENMRYVDWKVRKILKKTLGVLLGRGYIKTKGRPPKRYYLTYEGKKFYHESLLWV